MKKIWMRMKNWWTRFKAALTSKPKLSYVALGILKGFLAGIACSFTLVSLGLAFGVLGLFGGLIMIGAIGWLHSMYEAGEERGVRYFGTTVLTFMALPWFAAATGMSIVPTIILGTLFWLTMNAANQIMRDIMDKLFRNAFASVRLA